MPNERRRNKRKITRIKDLLTMKNFLIIVGILAVIICISIGVMIYRNYQDKQLLAKQKDEVTKQIDDIFTETLNNISTTNEEVEKMDKIVRISAVGDILCGDEMLMNAKNEDNSYDFNNIFKNVSQFFERSDVTVGTMETNFTNAQFSGYNKSNSPREFAMAVKKAGVNLVSLAHNHALDYGVDGIKDTKRYLQEMEYNVAGDRLEGNNVLVKEVKGVKIAFLAYTYGVNDEGGKTNKELDSVYIFNEEQAKQDIEYAKENADTICVLMHWGDMYSNEVSDEQKKIADFLVDNGVTLIIGTHPATVQPMEIRQNKEGKNVLVAYSLGNFCSSISEDNAKVELILNIELRKSGEDGEVYLKKVDYTPLYMLDKGATAENRYEIVDMKNTALQYASGNEVVSRETYNKLINGLDLLEQLLKQD
jgi:poly-gamma-glutamate capsule biosynthesis protein CapA/YwtB (metallophosphatase superfamily)